MFQIDARVMPRTLATLRTTHYNASQAAAELIGAGGATRLSPALVKFNGDRVFGWTAMQHPNRH
jgi:hypothetical protein